MEYWRQMENNRMLLKTNFQGRISAHVHSYLHAMRSFLLFLMVCLMGLSSEAQQLKTDKAATRSNYFYLNGVVTDYDISTGNERPAPYAQVVVYQNNELYVAFFGGEDGSYSFFLPLGFEYDVRFGGSAFINKKIAIDATQIDKESKPRNVELNVSLFRPVEGADFTMLEEPFARIIYDPEIDAVRMDEEYGRKRKIEVERSIKKAKKLLQASDALAHGMN